MQKKKQSPKSFQTHYFSQLETHIPCHMHWTYITHPSQIQELKSTAKALEVCYFQVVDALFTIINVWLFFQLECCGSKNYTDWFYKEWTTDELGNNSVPQSCCVKSEANCNINVTEHPNTIYAKVLLTGVC